MKIKLGDKEIAIGIGVLVIIFSYVLFGISGVKTIAAAFLFFLLPFYIILDNFDLEKGEKIAFSFFIGIGVFSAIVYYAGILFGSIRIATIFTFILLLGIGLLLRKFLPNKKPGSNDNN